MGVEKDAEVFREYAEKIRNEKQWGHAEISHTSTEFILSAEQPQMEFPEN